MNSKENIFLFISAALIVLLILTQTNFDSYVPIVFGLSFTLFIIEKILLNDSLKFTSFTLPSFFLVVYIVVIIFPSMLIFSTMTDPIKYTFFLAVQSVLITFPLGVALANLKEHNPNKIIRDYVNSKIDKSPIDLKLLPIYHKLIKISVIVLLLFVIFSNNIQLIEIIKAYPTAIDIVRLKFIENELPKLIHYLFEIVRRFILPVCLIYVYMLSILYKSKWKFRFKILFLYSLIVNALTLDRGPIIALFAIMILSYLLAKNRLLIKIINIKIILIILITFTIAGLISIGQYQSNFTYKLLFENVLYVFFFRVIQDPSYMASLAFTTFNSNTSFLYGANIRLFSFLPGYYYAESLGTNPLVAAPVSFIGDLWRNWGWPGVIIGSIFIGYIYQLIQLKLFRRKNIMSLTLQIVLLLNATWIIWGNTLGIMTTSVFLFSILFNSLYSNKNKYSKI